MLEETKRENAEAAALIERGWSAAAIADHFGITVDGLYQRGRRDPGFGKVLATVKRPHQVRSTAAEERLIVLWFQPERYTVAQIGAALGITRQTVYRWAHDLDLPMVRREFRIRGGAEALLRPDDVKLIATLARRLRIGRTGAARLLASFQQQSTDASR